MNLVVVFFQASRRRKIVEFISIHARGGLIFGSGGYNRKVYGSLIINKVQGKKVVVNEERHCKIESAREIQYPRSSFCSVFQRQ